MIELALDRGDGEICLRRADGAWFSLGGVWLDRNEDGGATLRVRMSGAPAELVAKELGITLDDVRPSQQVREQLASIEAKVDSVLAMAATHVSLPADAVLGPPLGPPKVVHPHRLYGLPSGDQACEFCDCVFSDGVTAGYLPPCPAR